MAVPEEALAPVLAPELGEHLPPGGPDQLGVIHSKRWEPNDGQQAAVHLLAAAFAGQHRLVRKTTAVIFNNFPSHKFFLFFFFFGPFF